MCTPQIEVKSSYRTTQMQNNKAKGDRKRREGELETVEETLRAAKETEEKGRVKQMAVRRQKNL